MRALNNINYGTWQKKVSVLSTEVYFPQKQICIEALYRIIYDTSYGECEIIPCSSSRDEFLDPDFCICKPFFGQAARNLDVTLSQTPVEENSLLHVIRAHRLQLLSHSLKEGKYDNIKADDDTRS